MIIVNALYRSFPHMPSNVLFLFSSFRKQPKLPVCLRVGERQEVKLLPIITYFTIFTCFSPVALSEAFAWDLDMHKLFSYSFNEKVHTAMPLAASRGDEEVES